jgi:hypothetical protein
MLELGSKLLRLNLFYVQKRLKIGLTEKFA